MHPPALSKPEIKDPYAYHDEDVAELRQRNPAADVVVVEDAGHSIQGDKPVELAELFRALLDG